MHLRTRSTGHPEHVVDEPEHAMKQVVYLLQALQWLRRRLRVTYSQMVADVRQLPRLAVEKRAKLRGYARAVEQLCGGLLFVGTWFKRLYPLKSIPKLQCGPG